MSLSYPGGYISKTPPTPTSTSAPGIWTLDQAMQFTKSGNWPVPLPPPDPYFEYTTLLLPGNGTNGAQNNTFLDSSGSSVSITRNGSSTQGTFSPFSQTGWSNYFDGSGDSVVTPTNSAFDGFGNGTSWQIDFWWWPISGAIQWDGPFETVGGAGIFFRNRSGYLDFINNNDNFGLIRSDYPSLNTWHYIVLVCDGATNQRSVFIDGTRTGTITNTAQFNNGSIGIATPGVGTFNAYISDFRVIKGSRTFDPASSTITVPTSPSTAVSGTVLLTCQGNRFRDASSNNFSLTVGGNPSVQAFSPFNPTAAYSAATNGGSGYFAGYGNYLTFPNSIWTALAGVNTTFTVEAWVYRTAADSQSGDICGTNVSGYTQSVTFNISTSGALQFSDWGNGSSYTATATASGSVPLNAWTHVAASKSGSTMRLFVNGVLLATNTIVNASISTLDGSPANVAGRPAGATMFIGYMSSLRIVPGTAVYTANFTPPTGPLTAISGTSLLLNFTNAAIIDSTAKNDLQTVGNAQISTAQSKFGGSSIAFDGNGDAVISAATPLFQLSTNWTIEGWFNTTSRTGDMRYITVEGSSYQVGLICGGGGSGGSTNDLVLNRFGSGDWIRASGILAGTDGTWNHIAIVCSNGTIKLYFNGVNVGGTSTNTMPTGNCFITAGASVNYSSYSYNGYQDDIRVTTGVARYTSNFTPPTQAFAPY